MNQAALEKYLWGAATYLRGHIDAGDYKQFIFPLLFFKRVSDVYDEEFAAALAESGGDRDYAAVADHHRFQIPPGAHWRDVRAVTVNVGLALQGAMTALEKANPRTLDGIFGDANWGNKDRLSDETLVNLLEHFSAQTLDIASVPDDQLGDAYEYLIKEFADDSGHTAAEFYTNRTVVRLMTLIMDPQPGESVYDPTCGSGGLLLNCALQLKAAGREYRTLKLYGQEINLITSGIARMNMFLHGIEEFAIARGNTLSEPAHIAHDRLKTFNVVLANPPYSIKSWDRDAFANDPWGRNLWGTPPQGCADYAFQQHIQKSLDPETGRCAILWPHGILFRDQEKEMRRKMVEADLVEAVIALGKNLFYNSSMESCILVCRTNKPKGRRNKILFVNAYDEIRHDKTVSFLDELHIQKILSAFHSFKDEDGFAAVVKKADVAKDDASLLVTKYLKSARVGNHDDHDLESAITDWRSSSQQCAAAMEKLFSHPL